MRFDNLPILDLKLFDGGAAAAGNGGEGNQGGNPGETQVTAASTRRGHKSGEFQNVIFGKPPAEAGDPAPEGEGGHSDAGNGEKGAGGPEPSGSVEDKSKAYREMIKGEYKEQYEQDVQHLIDRRFRDAKRMEKQLNDLTPLLDVLAVRYNIADGNLDKLLAAVKGDKTYLAIAAEKAGMTEDQYSLVEGLRLEKAANDRENARRELAKAMHKLDAEAEQQEADWRRQAEAAKEVYPDLDIDKEIKDPRFRGMLKNGVDVATAYRAKHIDDIIDGAVKEAVQKAEKQITDNVRARGQRPAENGASSQSGYTYKSDPSKMTKAERAEIARRVKAGAVIEL